MEKIRVCSIIWSREKREGHREKEKKINNKLRGCQEVEWELIY